MAIHGFLSRHEIFPASAAASNETERRRPSPEEIAAIIAAARASTGTRWERPAGALAPETLALPVSA